MKNSLRLYSLLPVFLLFVMATTPAEAPQQEANTDISATTYSADKAHSMLGFKVRHLGIANVRGSFQDYSVSLTMDGDDVSTVSATAIIQTASIDTGIERRDNHLRSDDFFNAEQYPTIKFESTEVRNIDDDEFELVGNLTIRDITHEVVLEAEFLGSGMMRGTKKIGFSAETEIDRFDFNLQWDNKTADNILVVDDTIKIELELEMNAEG